MTDSVSNPENMDSNGTPDAVLEDTGEAVTSDEATEGAAEQDAVGAAADAPATGELASLRAEVDALNDRHLRLAAEFNNYRRRVEQERGDLWVRAQAEVVGRLVDVLDDLQRVAGMDLGNATVDAILEGIDLVDRKFVRALTEVGVEAVAPEGQRFNPETMEAMMRVPTEAQEEDDQVAHVFQKGYTLKGVLVRPARVSVLKLG